MKNFEKIIRIIALAAITGILFLTCATAKPESTGTAVITGITENTGTAVITDISGTAAHIEGTGMLIITGLGDFNGYFAYAQGFLGGSLIFAAADIAGSNNNLTATGITIRNDSIILPVWALSYNYDNEKKSGFIEKTPFEGNGSAFMMLTISENEHYHWQSASSHADATIYVTFNNGRAAGLYK